MADDPLVFDTTRCQVDPVTPIPDENLLKDPQVPEPPPDIPDCDGSDIPPLPPEPPCPDLSAGRQELVYGGNYADNPPKVVFEVKKGKCCDFDFEIEIDIPCPAIGPESSSKPVPSVSGPGSVVFGFLSLIHI